jgi:hypothetical protein
MASLRARRRKQCGNKVRYPDETEAVSHAIGIGRKLNTVFRAYRCKFCRGWHIGNNKPLLRYQELRVE